MSAAVQRYAVHLETLVRFAAQQASGQPTGAHAAFKPYGVDSVTVRLVEAPGKVPLLGFRVWFKGVGHIPAVDVKWDACFNWCRICVLIPYTLHTSSRLLCL